MSVSISTQPSIESVFDEALCPQFATLGVEVIGRIEEVFIWQASCESIVLFLDTLRLKEAL